MTIRKINESKLLAYIDSCEAERNNIAQKVSNGLRNGMVALGITEDKINEYLEAMTTELTKECTSTLEFCNQFVEYEEQAEETPETIA
jgi:hypothetical protein